MRLFAAVIVAFVALSASAARAADVSCAWNALPETDRTAAVSAMQPVLLGQADDAQRSALQTALGAVGVALATCPPAVRNDADAFGRARDYAMNRIAVLASDRLLETEGLGAAASLTLWNGLEPDLREEVMALIRAQGQEGRAALGLIAQPVVDGSGITDPDMLITAISAVLFRAANAVYEEDAGVSVACALNTLTLAERDRLLSAMRPVLLGRASDAQRALLDQETAVVDRAVAACPAAAIADNRARNNVRTYALNTLHVAGLNEILAEAGTGADMANSILVGLSPEDRAALFEEVRRTGITTNEAMLRILIPPIEERTGSRNPQLISFASVAVIYLVGNRLLEGAGP